MPVVTIRRRVIHRHNNKTVKKRIQPTDKHKWLRLMNVVHDEMFNEFSLYTYLNLTNEISLL